LKIPTFTVFQGMEFRPLRIDLRAETVGSDLDEIVVFAHA